MINKKPKPCFIGFYCPIGTTTSAYIDISDVKNKEHLTSSKLCAPGFYSDVKGLGSYKKCEDGFECYKCIEKVTVNAMVKNTVN